MPTSACQCDSETPGKTVGDVLVIPETITPPKELKSSASVNVAMRSSHDLEAQPLQALRGLKREFDNDATDDIDDIDADSMGLEFAKRPRPTNNTSRISQEEAFRFFETQPSCDEEWEIYANATGPDSFPED